MAFEHGHTRFELSNVFVKRPWAPMKWDEACEASRGLLDYMETEIPEYVEQAFSVHRRKNIIGTGVLMRFDSTNSSVAANASESAMIIIQDPPPEKIDSPLGATLEALMNSANGNCGSVDTLSSDSIA